MTVGGHLPASGDVQSAGGAGGVARRGGPASPGGGRTSTDGTSVSLAYKVRSVISRESWLVSYGGNQSTGWTVS